MKNAFLLIAIVFGLLLQCTNNTPLPNGYELLNRDDSPALLPPITLYPVEMGYYWKSANTGQRSTLLLGRLNDVQSFIIFQNRNLVKVDSGATLKSAELVLYGEYVHGSGPINISVHPVTMDWEETLVIWEDIQNGYDAQPIEQFELEPKSGEANRLTFTNLDFITAWIQDSYHSEPEMKGILLRFDRAENAAEFSSSDAGASPAYMELIAETTTGELDTVNAFLTKDASLLQNQDGSVSDVLNDSPEYLPVGSASGYRSLLKFDFAEIPEEATIHKALLTLTVDQQNSYTKTDSAASFSQSIQAHAVLDDSTWNPTTIKLDTLNLTPYDAADAASETFAFDGSDATRGM